MLSGFVNAEQEEQERQKLKDASLNDHLMYMYQLQNLANHKAGVTRPNGEIGGQPISVVSPPQVSLMQLNLPDKNPDIPLLGSSSSKPSESQTKAKKKALPLRKPVFDFSKQVFPFSKRVFPVRSSPVRPRLVGTFRIKTPGSWRPATRNFWKRDHGINKRKTENKVKHLRQMSRKKSKRKSLKTS